MNLLLILLLLAVAIVAAIDIIPMARDWVGRIHIGRYRDRESWTDAITKTGAAWLNRTPVIPVTDNTRLVAIDIVQGNYSKAAIQHWQEGALLLGFAEYLQTCEDPEVTESIRKFLEKQFDVQGQWRKKPQVVDAALLAYAVMKLPFVEANRYKAAFDTMWACIQAHIGEDGTVKYRPSMGGYRYVDTIGFICPFLICYGLRFQNKNCIDLAVRQIGAYAERGMLPIHHIPCHAYQVENKMPLGLFGWGRGLGWYAIGLIDAWNELPAAHEYKSVLEEHVKQFARTVLHYQQETGSWNWVVTRPESRPDSSTTATLGWYLLQASHIPELKDECLRSASKALDYLAKVTRRNGAVDFSQGDTKDIGVYSKLFNILPFTQGFCIRASAYLKRCEAG